MSLRSLPFVRLVLVALLLVSAAASVEAQSCTAPTPVQVAGSYCAGEPLTLDAGPGWASYVWSNGQTGRYMTDAPVVDTSYTVTVTDGAGCEATSAPFVQNVSGTTTAPTVSAPSTMCMGAQGTATAQYPPDLEPSGMNRMEWTIAGGHFYDPAGTNPTTAAGESVQFVAAGPSPVTLHATAFSMGNCATGTATVQVTLSSQPPVINAPPEVCPNGSGTASVAPPAGGGSWYHVEWQVLNGNFGWDPYTGTPRTFSNGESVVFYANNSGNPVELRARTFDFQYCETQASKIVAMRTIAPPVISAPPEMCPNGSATASVAPPAEGGSWHHVEWQILNGHFGWDPYTGSQRTYANGQSVVFYGDGSGNPVELRARAIDFQYCESQSSKMVAIAPFQPEMQVTPHPVPLQGPATASVAGTYSYISWGIERGWFTGGTSSNTVTFQADGTGPVKLRVSLDTGAGCYGSVEQQFFLEGMPMILDAPASFCSTSAPKTATLSTQGPAGNIVWSITNGTINAGQGTTELSFTPSSLADVTLSVSATLSGSPASTTKVIPYAAPVLEVYTYDDVACPLRRTPVEVRNAYEFVSLTASVENAVLSGSAPNFEIQAFNNEDVVTMTITGTTAEGCTATWTHTFQHPRMPELTYAPAALCSDGTQSVTLQNASSDYMNFAWMGIENGTWVTPPPSSGVHPATMSYRATGTAPVVLILRVQPRDLSCASDRRLTIPVVPAPAPPAIAASSSSICPGGSVTLTASAGASYLWSNGATTQSIAVTQPGNYTVSVTNAGGCAAVSAPATITADPPFTAGIDTSVPTSNLCENTPVTLTALPAGASYLWSNGATTQSITVSAGGTYSVTVTNANGCSDSESRTLSYQPLPNATITPSGPTTFCDGGGVWLDAAIGSYTYQWSNGSTDRRIYVSDSGTFSVTLTNSYGCSATSAPVTVTENVPVKPAIMASATEICPGGSTTLTASEAASYSWSTGEITRSITVSPSTGTYYWVTTTDANGCAARSDNFYVRVEAQMKPTITAYGSPAPYCDGETVTLVAPQYTPARTYLWSTGETTYSIQGRAPGTYTVTVTNPTGCSNTSDPMVLAVETPTATVSGTTATCAGGSATIQATLTGTAPWTVTWSDGLTQTGVAVSPATRQVSPSATTTYTVTAVRDANCSTGTASGFATVTVNPNPTVDIRVGQVYDSPGSGTIASDDGDTAEICGDPTIRLRPTVLDPANSYAWSTGATTALIDVRESGTYTLTMTDAAGCTATSSVTIHYNDPPPAPVIAESGPTTFCEGGSVTLTAPAGYTYRWSSGETTQSIAASTGGSYSVTVTNATGCSATSARTPVTVHPMPSEPTVTASGDTTFCQGGSVTLTAPEGYSYLWSNGVQTQSNLVSQSGSYSVTVTTANGCSATSAPVTVTVNTKPAGPVIAASGDTSFCEGGSVTLTAPGGYSYLWSTGEITQSINVSQSGPYSVTVTNASGCSATSDPTNITVNAKPATPVIAESGPTSFCEGGSVTLTAPSGYSYLWSTGEVTQSIDVSQSGPYSVTVTNASGCSATSAAPTVTVNAKPATPVIAESGPTSFCTGGSVTLTAPSGYSYLWSTGEITQSIDVSQPGPYSVTVTNASGCSATSAATTVTVNAKPATPVIAESGPTSFCTGGSVTLSAPSGYSYLWSTGEITQSIDVSQSGPYSVTVTNASGCSATSAATTVTVNAKPATPVIAESGPTSFCTGGSVTLTAPSGYSYLWSTGEITQSIDVSQPGSYSVTVTNASGCSATSAATTVTVNAKPATPVIAESGPTSFCTGGSVTLTAPSGYSYLWSTGEIAQSIDVSQPGPYSVTVTNASGCSATSAATNVTVHPKPATPVITPSGSTALCPGASVTLTAPAGYSYLWSTGEATQSINVSTAGPYSVTVTNANGCSTSSAPTTVTTYAPTAIQTQPQSATIARNVPRTLSVGATGTNLTYQWYQGSAGDTTQPLVGQISSSTTVGGFTKKGTYRYWVRVSSATCPSSTVDSATAVITVN